MNRFNVVASLVFVLSGSASQAGHDLRDCQISGDLCSSERQDISAQTRAALNPTTSVDVFGVAGGDILRPTVIDMNSVARADWSEPSQVIISSAITQIAITFSEPMAQDGVGSVRATENWLVLSSGANAVVDTAECDSVVGDDIALAINTINYDNSSRTGVLLLDSPTGLQAGAYRLLACSSLTDIAGLGLDGADNGGDAEDYTRDFRVTVNPRIVNPNFDQGLSGWTTIPDPNPGQAWIQILEDGEGQPYSGAARFHSSFTFGAAWMEQCTSVPDADSFSFSALARIQSGSPALNSIIATIDWFDGTGCAGNLLATQFSNPLLQSTLEFGELFISPAAAPATAQSARLRFDIRAPSSTSVNFDLDRVRFPDMDLLLRSGFEKIVLE